MLCNPKGIRFVLNPWKGKRYTGMSIPLDLVFVIMNFEFDKIWLTLIWTFYEYLTHYDYL